MSCRTGPLRVGRPLRGGYVLSRRDDLLWASRWSANDDADQREDPYFLFHLDNLKRRVNARPTRSGPVRQDMVFYVVGVVTGWRGSVLPEAARAYWTGQGICWWSASAAWSGQ